jgi:Putative stress-responsive transcriptional regulator
MKKVENVGIGGRSFVIEEDAYQKLSAYLDKFRTRTNMGSQTSEVMDEVEARIAELFSQETGGGTQVVTIEMVCRVIDQLGMPDGSNGAGTDEATSGDFINNKTEEGNKMGKEPKKFYRDSDNKVIGGVCSGLAAYFNIDVVLLRIIFIACVFGAGAGFWVYVILWIVAPLAKTATQKCEMRGLPVTAENLAKFTK